MLELIESVKKHGVLVPAIARPKPEGGYELVAGHRRQRASQLAGLDSMPVIVMNLDDNDTIIQLVDSNIQRENILPSERAKAYKLRSLTSPLVRFPCSQFRCQLYHRVSGIQR